jgi:hypothetical protein
MFTSRDLDHRLTIGYKCTSNGRPSPTPSKTPSGFSGRDVAQP